MTEVEAFTRSRGFMDLPPELRIEVSQVLNPTEEILSIFAIAQLPEVIQEVPNMTRGDTLDVYIGNNRFSITCLISLGGILAAGSKNISRIKHLRLGSGNRPLPEVPPTTPISERLCEVDVDLVSEEPGFTIRFTHGHFYDQDKANKVLELMGAALGTMSSRSNGRPFHFDADTLQTLVEHWLYCRR